MGDLSKYNTDEKGLPLQIFDGKEYRLYPNEKYFSRGTKRMHTVVWEHSNGPKPKGYHVHHMDEDTYNNEISNLKLVEAKKHQSEHIKKRFENNPEWAKLFQERGIAVAPAWHASEAGRDWHKNAWDNSLGVLFIERKYNCMQCSDEFTVISSNNTSKFCSNSCKSEHRRQSGVDDIEFPCTICGTHFTKNKYARTITCSNKCAWDLKRAKKMADNISKRNN